MKRRRGLPEDKQWLVLQFLKLSPTARMQYAIGFVDSALRVTPDLLKRRSALTAQATPRRYRR